MFTVKSWLARLRSQVLEGRKKNQKQSQKKGRVTEPERQPGQIGILSLEVAKIMSRIVYLHRSLGDDEMSRLRSETMQSEGVASLISRDEGFLLGLACAEKLEDLGRIADAVARLGERCAEPSLRGFVHIYADLARDGTGIGELGFPAVEVDERVRSMETYVSLTADLFVELETLKDMEASDKRMQQWRALGGPKANVELFRQKFAWQKQRVRHLRQVSLWNQTFDMAVGLMARMVCTIYARICFIFGPHVPGLPKVSAIVIMPVVSGGSGRSSGSRSIVFPRASDCAFRFPEARPRGNFSGPLERTSTAKGAGVTRSGPLFQSIGSGLAVKSGDLTAFYSDSLFRSSDVKHKQSVRSSKIHDFGPEDGSETQNFHFLEGQGWVPGQKNRLLNASPSTVGGSALALRYANVILLVQRLIQFPHMVGEDARCDLYQLLPTSLRAKIKTKHRQRGMKKESADCDDQAADCCREKLEKILEWLSPLAHDMVRWQSERSFEQQQFISRTNVLLMQTLYFADREKTEEAMAELLVGLSFICLYENRRSASEDLNVVLER
ncbi:hypothetical protein EJ110_NYTH21324 [Nymphaea thermarum]|nr:hypothetical protein EJ110_NYTH21324 [Nymphaea thermarum]